MVLRRYLISMTAALALVMTACTSQYTAQLASQALTDVHLKSSYKIDRQSEWVIHSTTAIFLAWPSQLEDSETQARGRHLDSLFASLRLGLEQAFPAFHCAQRALSLPEAFVLAEQASSGLLFWPKLVAVENRLNSPQELVEGRALHPGSQYGNDAAVFQVLVYEVRTRRLIDVATVFSRSHLFADTDSQAINLLDQAVKHYVYTITGKKAG